MKGRNYFLLLALLVCFYACGEQKTGEKKVAYYTFDLPSKGKPEKIKDQRVIHWDNNAHIHLLRLGTFTTPMTFAIFPAADRNTLANKPIMEKQFNESDTVVLNISTLKKGVYDMTFNSIGEGCRFQFTIE